MFSSRFQYLLKRLVLNHLFKSKSITSFKIALPTSNHLHILAFNKTPIYSFSSFQRNLNLIDFKSELPLLTHISHEQLSHASKIMEKYTKCFHLSDLTSQEVEWISFILYELAIAHRNQGNTDKAFRYTRENEDLFKATGIKATFLLAQNYYLHACLHMDQKNLTDAEYSLTELEQVCRSLGEDKDAKSLMLQGWNSLADVYLQSDHHDKALKLYNLVLENINDAQPEAIPNVRANVYQGMGSIYKARNNIDKTIEYWTKSFEIAAQYFGENSPMTFGYFNQMAYFLYDEGQYPKALQYANKNLEIALNTFPKGSMEVGSSYLLLAHVLFRHLDYTKALASYKKALEFYESASPEYKIFLRDIYFQLVKIHAFQHEPQKASVFLAKANHALVLSNPGNQELFAQIYDNWAHELITLGNMTEEARTYFLKALDLYKSLTPPNQTRIQVISGQLGQIAFDEKEWNKAYEYLKEYEKYLTETQADPEVFAELYNYQGSICINLENYREAEKYLQKTVQSSQDMEKIGIAYYSFGIIFKRRGMKKEALEAFQKSLEFQEQIFPKDDPIIQDLLQIISALEKQLKVIKERNSQVIETFTDSRQK